MQSESSIEFLTVSQIAELLQLSPDAVTRRFEELPGVIDLGSPETIHKRRRRLLRIPRHVLTAFLQEHAR